MGYGCAWVGVLCVIQWVGLQIQQLPKARITDPRQLRVNNQHYDFIQRRFSRQTSSSLPSGSSI